MNHIATNQRLEEEALPVQEFLFDSKNLLVADQLFYKIGLDMKIQPFAENDLQAFRKKTTVNVENFNGQTEPQLEITFLTLNPKQSHTIRTALKNPQISENVFETEVTRVSLTKYGVDWDGNIVRENPFYSNVGSIKHRDITLKITPINKKEIQNFSSFLVLEAMRAAVRDSLYMGDLVAYYGQRKSIIESYEWAEDNRWYRFLADGHINTEGDHDFQGRIFFKKTDVYKWPFMNGVKPYDMHPSWLEILPHQYSSSNQEARPILKTVQESESTEPQKRAALRLLTLCQLELEKRGQSSFEKKHVLVAAIQELADKNGFEVTDDVQKRLSSLSDEEKDQLDKKAVSREDVKAIATLLRSLKQQGGTSFKKMGKPF